MGCREREMAVCVISCVKNSHTIHITRVTQNTKHVTHKVKVKVLHIYAPQDLRITWKKCTSGKTQPNSLLRFGFNFSLNFCATRVESNHQPVGEEKIEYKFFDQIIGRKIFCTSQNPRLDSKYPFWWKFFDLYP